MTARSSAPTEPLTEGSMVCRLAVTSGFVAVLVLASAPSHRT